MDTKKLAEQARTMVETGEAKNIVQAIQSVTRQALARTAGTFTARAERDWIADVTRVEQATR